jgi:ubiquinone/menaquinone biosynthesis C-methylase UbiE
MSPKFQQANYFPLDYHGGIDGPVWDEKLLEHWIASERLGLMNWQAEDTYVDVAACSSPWAKILREHFGMQAFAIDLGEVGNNYKEPPYYRVENATATTFKDVSITVASLQCAYEMFMNKDDINFIKEIARILKPGGKVVILPLYMHTHYCSCSTPEYYGKGYSDPNAKEYVRRHDFGVPSARIYDAETLKQRVLDPIESYGMHYQLLALRNKFELGRDIYCHFILEISK